MKTWPGDDLVVEAATSREAMDRLVPHIYELVRFAQGRSVYRSQKWFRQWGEDAVQEAVIRCTMAVGRFEPERGLSLHFFRKCIRYCWSDERKRVQRLSGRPAARPTSIDAEDFGHISRDLRVEQIGERATSSKVRAHLPEEAVRDIRDRLERGERISQIARDIHIGRERISKIKRGLSYRDVI